MFSLQVPQQRSGEECGIFVLYFIYLFLQSAPDNFSQEGYSDFVSFLFLIMGTPPSKLISSK